MLSLMVNGASPIATEAKASGFVVKTLFSSKVQIIFNPNKLVNNIMFLWDFAIDHLAYAHPRHTRSHAPSTTTNHPPLPTPDSNRISRTHLSLRARARAAWSLRPCL